MTRCRRSPKQQFGHITKLAAWSAAAYDGSIRVPLGVALAQSEELDRVASHEFVHAVVAMLALPKLHRGFVGLSTRDAEIAYATAARAVRRLIEQRGVNALVALLEDLRRGAPFARAFDQRIAIPYEDFAALVSRD